MFGTQTIAALAVGGVLAIIIPIAAAVVFKLKNREAWLPSVFIGAGTFLLFALVLESLLHQVMIPLVQNSTALYCIYGSLAAGIFEETGRFVAYKTLMRKHYSTKNAVFMGIGHGGFEAMAVLGFSLLQYVVLAFSVNALGIDAVVEQTTGGNAELAETARQQLEAIAGYNFASMGMGVYERIIAMIFHVCMSVVVYKAASQKGKLWLYPCAVLVHAAMDFPVTLYQRGVLTNIALMYVILTAFSVIAVFLAVLLAKKLPDKE
ncbi:MAG: YhfC family intramembrane metalloprotease [Lachnospiraceae bacterium]|nr:YhfC family intramembrane metalloprotease [Ruminococcus sp.]MCM1276176.1 YhfC family intramembrane metalloprotease [Lachnospiraceae bacterium]